MRYRDIRYHDSNIYHHLIIEDVISKSRSKMQKKSPAEKFKNLPSAIFKVFLILPGDLEADKTLKNVRHFLEVKSEIWL